jgi:hypothetical protein
MTNKGMTMSDKFRNWRGAERRRRERGEKAISPLRSDKKNMPLRSGNGKKINEDFDPRNWNEYEGD